MDDKQAILQGGDTLTNLFGRWPCSSLNDLVDSDRGISYGIVQPGTHTDHGVPIVRVDDIQNRRLAPTAPLRVSQEIEQKYKRTRLQGDEVLLTLVGAYLGQSAVVPSEYVGWNTARAVAVIPVRPEIGSRWVHLCLHTPQLQHLIWTRCTTTAQPTLNLRDVARLPIPLPKPEERERITAIFDSLDEKIDLNRQMNHTLEAIIHTLFQSWFMNFDPVTAKFQGRQPDGLDAATARLFPDSLVESPHGPVPKGWRTGMLGDFFTIGLGGVWGDDLPSDRANTPIKCLRGIDCHDLATGSLPEIPMRWVSSKQALDRKLSDGVILIEGSGSFCGRSLCWNSAYADLIEGNVAYSNFCKRLNPKVTASQSIICWLQLRGSYESGELHAFRTGTAFPNFDVNGALAKVPIILPPASIADRFERLFRIATRLDLIRQNQTLAAIRDALLPKLLSGEVGTQSAAHPIQD